MEHDDIIPRKLAAVGRVRFIPPTIERPSDSDLLALARSHALDDFPEDEQPWFCPVTISSDQTDSHYTFMDTDTTLPNFSAEAGDERGVGVLDSHNNSRQPFGRSVIGELTESEGVNVVASWFYTVPGVRTSSGMMTDDYIKNIKYGLSKEISVGFNFRDDGWVECSICKKNMMSWDCEHWPGQRYEHPVDLNDPEGEKMESLALGRIINGHLSEYSFVYKGSNRESQTLRLPEAKARMFTAGGMIGEKQAFALERAYDIDLHPWIQPRVFTSTGRDIPLVTIKKETTPVAHADMTVTVEWNDELREVFSNVLPDGVPDDPQEAFRALADRLNSADTVVKGLHEDLTEARAEVERLKPLAADGESYRADLVNQAINAGIRAMDPTDDSPFPEEDVRGMLENASVKSIIAYRDSQLSIGNRMIPEGRLSRDELDSYRQEPAGDDKAPVEAYASGRNQPRRRR
jgi:hypothetical protein